MNDWQGLPYHPISLFYKNKFGKKVYKIPVSTAQTCPNREGIAGMETCIFCDEWGSAAYPENRDKKLIEQIEKNKNHLKNLYKASHFLVYFQAYTNTFGKSSSLISQIEAVLGESDIHGVVVGTRPDCLSDAILDYWAELAEKHFLAVELGVQSFRDKDLIWMKRGHLAKKSFWAIQRLSRIPKLDLGIHLMFGLPDENDKALIEAAKICNDLPITNVKIHNLHVLKNTPLEEMYFRGEYQPDERLDYFRKVALFLSYLRPEIAVHRLAALSTRKEELIAPEWTSRKMETYQGILDFINEREIVQGCALESSDFPFEMAQLELLKKRKWIKPLLRV